MLLFLLLLLPLHRPLPFLIIRSDRAAKPRPVDVAPHPSPLLTPLPLPFLHVSPLVICRASVLASVQFSGHAHRSRRCNTDFVH